MEKVHLDRRLDQMRREGTVFRAGIDVGSDLTGPALLDRYDAVVIAVGATAAGDLPVPGRELAGIHQAMEYLPQSNRASLGEEVDAQITAAGKNVVIIGGGDTGADCLGTATGRAPPASRSSRSSGTADVATRGPALADLSDDVRVSAAHEEAGDRAYSVSTKRFLGDESGTVRALGLVEVVFEGGRFNEVEGSEREIPAELVLFAMGFTGPERPGLIEQLEVELDERGNVSRDDSYASSVDGVFVAGDAGRGQSLIVWAIAEGRAAAAAVDEYLTGSPTALPTPAIPTDGADPARFSRSLSATTVKTSRVGDPDTHAQPDQRGFAGPATKLAGTSNPRTASSPVGSSRAKSKDRVHPWPGSRDARADSGARRRRHGRRAPQHEPRHLCRPREDVPTGPRGVRRVRARRRHLRRPAGSEDPAGHRGGRPPQAEEGLPVHDHHSQGARRRHLLRDDVRRPARRCQSRRPDPDRRRQGPVEGSRGQWARRVTEVVVAGKVSDHKGINLPGVAVSVPALSEKDVADLRWALRQTVDFIALSFVRSAKDAEDVRRIMDEEDVHLPVIAKIEKPQAIDNLDEIVAAFDGIMVARGDLGVECPLEDVPFLQKQVIDKARRNAKPVIVATQMLESMISSPAPTRAEASDVANALLDGADAVMLSGETSVGEYPIQTVETMAKILCPPRPTGSARWQPSSGTPARAAGSSPRLPPRSPNGSAPDTSSPSRRAATPPGGSPATAAGSRSSRSPPRRGCVPSCR